MDRMVCNYSAVESGYITDDRLCDVRRYAKSLLSRATRHIRQCLFAGEAPIDPVHTEGANPCLLDYSSYIQPVYSLDLETANA
jgi:hypothetical protein